MWNGRHPSENGDDGINDSPGGDPARNTAVSAASSLTTAAAPLLHNPTLSQQPSTAAAAEAAPYPPNAPPQDNTHATGQAMDHPSDAMDVEDEVNVNDNNNNDNNNNNNDNGNESETVAEEVAATAEVVVPKPRGKPEAMAVKLAAAALEQTQIHDEEAEAEVVAEPVMDDSMTVTGDVLVAVHKPKAKSRSTTPKRPKKKVVAAPDSQQRSELLLSEKAPPISNEEYENLERLMIQFCRVPLLAEFSRPVTLLHPELAAAYSKIVTHPVDLGHVCRGIRRRQYKNTRDVRLDMWRVFANCVKFHSHPNNKEAVPSFVSIALHLCEFFNYLWQEYMLSSDPQEDASDVQKKAFARREEDRKKRFENLRVLVLSKSALLRVAQWLGPFIKSGGLVDKLDKEPVFGEECIESDRDLDVVIENLKQVQVKLEEKSLAEEEYTFDEFGRDLKRCYQHEVLEDNHSLRLRIGYRLDRFTGKFFVPLCEANSRGVTQSSIWGNIAAVIWARESSKKPFWPALCLGMLPPEDQREGWHGSITERNELRLPEKLRGQLMTAKRRCEGSQNRMSLSYFLVEFLGTHEFIWVRETDIVEKFDPQDDPNKRATVAAKKKRASRSSSTSVVGSKTYATALEECGWAAEEYEMTLTEAFEDAFNEHEHDDDDDDGEEINYSYALLGQSDDEADDEDRGFQYSESTMALADIDEANWLITHEGKLDTSATGRKNAKRRTQAMMKKKKTAGKEKKVPAESTKKAKATPTKKKKGDSRTKDREEKRELRDLEKRRRKRQREREKVLRSQARKLKRRRAPSADSDGDDRGLHRDKRARSTAIVKAYLTRAVKNDDYKSLGLAGVMTIPAAMVDSTGLLGMALAFRAAGGGLAMPDETDEAKAKPWEAIDADAPKTYSERTDNLEQKIKLLQDELRRVQSNTERRKQLAAEAVTRRTSMEIDVVADDVAARQNHFKKKKKAASPKTDKTPADDSEIPSASKEESAKVSTEADAENDDPTETEAEPMEAEAEVAENDEPMARADDKAEEADGDATDDEQPTEDGDDVDTGKDDVEEAAKDAEPVDAVMEES